MFENLNPIETVIFYRGLNPAGAIAQPQFLLPHNINKIRNVIAAYKNLKAQNEDLRNRLRNTENDFNNLLIIRGPLHLQLLRQREKINQFEIGFRQQQEQNIIANSLKDAEEELYLANQTNEITETLRRAVKNLNKNIATLTDENNKLREQINNPQKIEIQKALNKIKSNPSLLEPQNGKYFILFEKTYYDCGEDSDFINFINTIVLPKFRNDTERLNFIRQFKPDFKPVKRPLSNVKVEFTQNILTELKKGNFPRVIHHFYDTLRFRVFQFDTVRLEVRAFSTKGVLNALKKEQKEREKEEMRYSIFN